MIDERYGEAETRKIAEKLLSVIIPSENKATVVGLSGDLGAGKTTLTQAIAEVLGVEETIQSPTFVIAKFYPTGHNRFVQLIHIDAYRIESEDELVPLGFEEILSRPNTLVVIEWPERIVDALPTDTMHFTLSHDDTHRRSIHG